MRPRTLLAAISPCPNDTFCFQPWADQIIESSLVLDLAFRDIEELNILAMTSAPYDITKLSTACLPFVEKEYVPLSSGAAFAIHGGPKVVARHPFAVHEISQKRLAIPGKHTTAYVAFSLLYGHPQKILQMPASQIIQNVLDGHSDAGLVIHEGRDVALRHGLFDIADIGGLYQARYGAVLPLGVIVAKRSLGEQSLRILNETLRRSIQEARARSSLTSFVCTRAQEQSPEILWKHIDRYVTAETELMTEEASHWIHVFTEAVKNR